MGESTYGWYRTMVDETQRRLASLVRLGEDPERFHGTARSPEGVIATMAHTGAPVDLQLPHSVMRLAPETLAAAILATQREAAAQAAERFREAMREAVPDAEVGRFDRASVQEAGERLRDELRASGRWA